MSEERYRGGRGRKRKKKGGRKLKRKAERER